MIALAPGWRSRRQQGRHGAPAAGRGQLRADPLTNGAAIGQRDAGKEPPGEPVRQPDEVADVIGEGPPGAVDGSLQPSIVNMRTSQLPIRCRLNTRRHPGLAHKTAGTPATCDLTTSCLTRPGRAPRPRSA